MGRGRQAAAPAGAEPESVGLPGLRGGVAGVKWELLTAPLRAARLVLGAAAALKIALCSSAFLKTVSPQNLLKTPASSHPQSRNPDPPSTSVASPRHTGALPCSGPERRRPRAPPAPGARTAQPSPTPVLTEGALKGPRAAAASRRRGRPPRPGDSSGEGPRSSRGGSRSLRLSRAGGSPAARPGRPSLPAPPKAAGPGSREGGREEGSQPLPGPAARTPQAKAVGTGAARLRSGSRRSETTATRGRWERGRGRGGGGDAAGDAPARTRHWAGPRGGERRRGGGVPSMRGHWWAGGRGAGPGGRRRGQGRKRCPERFSPAVAAAAEGFPLWKARARARGLWGGC